MNAEHRKPLAALFVVFAVACLIMANGLRNQVVDVLIGSGPSREVTSAIAPDMVLGQSLHDVPAPPTPQQPPAASAKIDRVVAAPTVAVASSVAQSASLTQPKKSPHHTTNPVTKPKSHTAASSGSGQAAPAANPSSGATPKPVPSKGVVTEPVRPAFTTPGTGSLHQNSGGHAAWGHWNHHTHSTQQAHLVHLAAPAKSRGHRHVDPPRRADVAQGRSSGAHETRHHGGAGHRDHRTSGPRHGARDQGNHADHANQGNHANRGGHANHGGQHSGHHR